MAEAALFQVDWTISIGAVVQTATIAVGGIGVVAAMRADLAHITKRLDRLDDEAEKQTNILVQLAEQKVRQDEFGIRLSELTRRLDRDPHTVAA